MFWLLAIIYTYSLLTAALLYIFICGPTEFHKNGCVGKLHRYLTSLPERMLKNCQNNCCTKFFSKYVLCRERNPGVKILFLVLLTVNVILMLIFAFDKIPNSQIAEWYRWFGVLLLLGCYWSFLKACYSDPGVITKENHHIYAKTFPNDNLMYAENRKCKTCGFVKPARSKHCTVMNQCVSKFDHYCIWLDNDVGELNYRWFHAFLIINGFTYFYGAYVYIFTIYSFIVDQNLWNATFETPNGKISSNGMIIFQYLVTNYIVLIAQAFFIFCCGCMVFFFWCYHLYLAAYNTTTNESFKWKDVSEMYDHLIPYVKKGRNISKEARDGKEKESEVKVLETMEKKIKNDEKLNYIYNLGIVNNLKQVIFPPSLYHNKTK